MIELLAVIVILAIIALIATPIILGIIKDTKKQSTIRSSENYLRAVEQAIAKTNINNESSILNGTYSILSNGNLCLDSNESGCISELKIEVNGYIPSSGTITVKEGKIISVILILKNKNVLVKLKDQLVYYTPICKAVTSDTKTAGNVPSNNSMGQREYKKGDEYICEVKEGIQYRFFILSIEDDNINLILDRNINSDGTLAENEVNESDSVNGIYNIVSWNSNGVNGNGPITVMDFLYNATKDWTNIPNIKINYEDEGNIGDFGYGTIKSDENITTITKKDNVTVIKSYENLKARLVYKKEIYKIDMENKTNVWMYNYLNLHSYAIKPGNGFVNGKFAGYWTMTSNSISGGYANCVFTSGSINETQYVGSKRGIRPVITLPKYMLF